MTPCPFDGLCSDLGLPAKRRSLAQHKRFFKIVSAAYINWPLGFEFQPDNPLHLRKWATCYAGWRWTTTLEEPGIAERAANIVILALKQRGEPAWHTQIGGKIAVISSRSIAFSDMRHKQACEVFARAEDRLCEIIGFENGDALLKAADKARAA